MKLQIVVAPEAQAQADELIAWWSKYRPAAKPLEVEIQRVLELISGTPGLGKPNDEEGIAGLRTHPLRNTPYAIYYVPDHDSGIVCVLGFWSLARGEGPPLRFP